MIEGRSPDEGRGTIDSLMLRVESRRKRAALYTLLPLFAIILVGFVILFFTGRNLRDEMKRLESQRNELSIQKQEIEAEKQKVEAEKQQVEAAKLGFNVGVSKYYNQASPEEQKALKNSLESSPTLTSVAARVYIQIHDEAQRAQALKVSAALQRAGFVVPGVEKRSEPVGSTQVKFFNPEDRDTAGKVAAILSSNGVKGASPSPSKEKAPQGQIEVWFAPASTTDERAEQQEQQEQQGQEEQHVRVALLNGNFRNFDAAVAYAKEVEAKKPQYAVEIYRHQDGVRFYVTLGGGLSIAEANKRVAYAKQTGLSKGAYVSPHAVGGRLYP